MRSHSSSKVCSSDLFGSVSRFLSALLALVGALAFTASPMWAQNATLTDDAQTSTSHANKNFGTAQSLQVVGGADRVFVKFTLPENLPPGTVGAHIGKATLKLFVNAVNNPGPLGVASVSGGWSEATITNATAPAVGSLVGFFNIIAAQTDQWLTLDVTSVVQGWVDNPASNNGFVLFAAAGGADLSFDSKENQNTSHQAQLLIVLNHAATADNATNAVTATNATQLGGVPAANFIKTGDPVLTAPRTPLPGSPNYIQNGTVPQPLANFNISGNGTVGGAFSTSSADVGIARNGVAPNVKLNVGGSNIQTELRIQDDKERAVLSLDSTIGGQQRVYTVENGIFGNPGLFGIYDRTAGQLRFDIDAAGKANIPGNLDIGLATAAEPNPNDNVKLRVHGGPFANGTGGGLTEAKIQSDSERTILSLDSTMGGKRYEYTLENGVFGQPGLFAIYDRVNAGIRFSIDPTGAVNIPLNLNVGQTLSANTLSTNTFSANTINANTQFTLGGARLLTSNPSLLNIAVGGGLVAPGANNSFFGTRSGLSITTGNANSFFGDTAGQHDQTGSRNSFIGSAAGFNNTSGTDNSFLGFFSGFANNASNNSFFGSRAGLATDQGSNNSFFGASAGTANTGGEFNAFFGDFAGASSTFGFSNSFFGSSAGSSVTFGEGNSFFGTDAGDSATNGSYNSILGTFAGSNFDGSLGSGNVLLGGFSEETFWDFLFDPSFFSGPSSQNVFVGLRSGHGNTTGSSNTLVGSLTDVGANNLSFATAIGAGAVVTNSNTIVLGRSSGADTVQVPGTLNTTALTTNTFSANTINANTQFTLGGTRLLTTNPSVLNIAVGGGVVAPGANNSFFGTRSGLSITTGNANSFFGDTAGQNNQDGSRNSFIGSAAGFLNRSGNDNSFLGFFAGSSNNGSNNSFFGSRAGRDTDQGFNNSFFGASAGQVNTEGEFNAFFGDFAGASSTTSFYNSFFGSASGFSVTSGEGNSFVGMEAGNSVTNGSYNSILGTFAGSNFDSSLGSGNVLVGGFSQQTVWDFFFNPASFTGPSSQNVFVGLRSGHGNVTGSSNTLLGSLTDVGAKNLSFATAIGAGSVVNTSNTITLGRSTGADLVQIPGMAAIGVPVPTSPLTVLGLIETDSAAGGVKFPDGSIQKTAGITGNVVRTLNGLSNDVTLTPGSPNVIITQASNNIAIAAHADATAILNQTTLQSPANFNIDGTGTVGTLFAPKFVASADYREAGGDTSILNDFGGNLRVGPNAGLGPTGSLNTYVGSDAGSNSVAPGNQNSFFGYQAGKGATSGDGGNTFAGAFSGPLNHGDNNSYFGRNTGVSSDTGSNNTLIGANANVAAAGLNNATAIGAGAIVAASDSLVLGNNVNVGIGTSLPTSRLTVAGFVESTVGGVKFPDGSIQTTAAAGAGPFVRSVNGLNNDVLFAAGSNVTITPSGNTLTISATGGGGGAGNVILNQLVLQSPANFNIGGTGKANIFDALTQYNLNGAKVLSIPGQDNLFVGNGAGSVPDPFGDNLENVFVGTQSGPHTTECCNAFFGNYTGKNNTTGQVNTFLGYQAGLSNQSGSDNTFVGSNAGVGHTTGDGNTFIGDTAGVGDVSGVNNTFVGRATGGGAALSGPHAGSPGTFNTFLGANATATQPANLTYATAIGAGSVVDDNNKIVLGRVTDLVSVPGTFSNPSDIRLKTAISTLNYGLNELLQLRPVTWKWKADANGRTQLGLIAQEVEPIIPELVLRGESKDHLLSMNYVGLLPIVVRAIQEQQAIIDELRRQLSQERVIGGPALSKINLESSSPTMSVIDGNITTNDRGEAVVEMPAGFQNAHSDFRYQLTVVGQFAQAIVAAEIANNRFSITTDKPNVKVSWQVTARRNSNVRVEDLAAGGAPEPPIPSATNMELAPSPKSTTPFRDK